MQETKLDTSKIDFAKLRDIVNRFLAEDFTININPNSFRCDRNTHPLVKSDFELVNEVNQFQSDFATDEKPIIVTCGMANCVGLLAYDLEKGIAFLGHTDSFSFRYTASDSFGNPSISAHVGHIFRDLSTKDETFNLTVIIAKGEFPESQYITTIRQNLNKPPSNVKIISITELDTDGSIGIDKRTGKLVSYDPKLNPFRSTDVGPAWGRAFFKSED